MQVLRQCFIRPSTQYKIDRGLKLGETVLYGMNKVLHGMILRYVTKCSSMQLSLSVKTWSSIASRVFHPHFTDGRYCDARWRNGVCLKINRCFHLVRRLGATSRCTGHEKRMQGCIFVLFIDSYSPHPLNHSNFTMDGIFLGSYF